MREEKQTQTNMLVRNAKTERAGTPKEKEKRSGLETENP